MLKSIKDKYFGFSNEEKNHQFILWQHEISVKQIQYILLLTGIIYIIISIINIFVLNININNLLIFLQLIVIPCYAFLISYCAYKKVNFKILETLLFLAPVFASLLHALIFSNLDTYSSYQTELYLMIFWTLTISGLRLNKAIISALFVFIVGEVYPYIFYEKQQTSFILHTMWMSVSLLFGVVGAFLLHQTKKDTFIKELELQELATIDKLTGVNNRSKLDSILPHELNKSKKYNQTIGVLLLDLDHFKEVNDTHGHLTGDEVLIAISKTLQKSIRSSDFLFRWGGEEFMIVCLEASQTAITTFAEQIRAEISKQELNHVGYKTVSIGATISNNTDSIDSLIQRADDALYEAKETGRNKVCFKL